MAKIPRLDRRVSDRYPIGTASVAALVSATAPPRNRSVKGAAEVQSNHSAAGTMPAPDGLDLTKTEPHAPAPASSPDEAVNQALKTFDAERHRAQHVGLALKALLVYVGIIITGSLILVAMHTEIQNVELLIFALIALLSIVAGPILGFFTNRGV